MCNCCSYPLILSINSTRNIANLVKQETADGQLNMIDSYLGITAKYEMLPGREAVVDLLKKYWPTSLSDWDKVTEGFTNMCDVPDPACAIMLARRHNIPEILPIAFYCLSTVSPLYHRRNKLDDGNMVIPYRDPRWGSVRPQGSRHRCARWELLGTREHMELATGKEHLRAQAARLFTLILESAGRSFGIWIERLEGL